MEIARSHSRPLIPQVVLYFDKTQLSSTSGSNFGQGSVESSPKTSCYFPYHSHLHHRQSYSQ